MSILDSVKKALIKEEEDNETPSVKQTPQVKATPAPEPQQNFNPTVFSAPSPVQAVSTSAETTEVDKDVVSFIWQTIIDKNLPGPDYLEFKDSAAGLVDVCDTEEKQMKGAFNVLRRSHPTFTKDVILASIDEYIGIVNDEKALGMAQCEDKRKINIGDRQNKIESYKASVAEIQKQIDELEKTKQNYCEQINVLTNEVATATADIAREEKIFINSVNNVIETLNADKAKVQSLNI